MDIVWPVYDIHSFTNGFCNGFISHALVFLLFWMDYSEVKKITVNI